MTPTIEQSTRRLEIHSILREARDLDGDMREAVHSTLTDEHGTTIGAIQSVSQFASFHVVALAEDGSIVDRNDDPGETVIFAQERLVAARDTMCAAHPEAWVETIGIFHDGRGWCLLPPVGRPIDRSHALDRIMEELAASGREPEGPSAGPTGPTP